MGLQGTMTEAITGILGACLIAGAIIFSALAIVRETGITRNMFVASAIAGITLGFVLMLGGTVWWLEAGLLILTIGPILWVSMKNQ